MVLPLTGAFHADFWPRVKYAKQCLSKHESPKYRISDARWPRDSVANSVFRHDGITGIFQSTDIDSNGRGIVFPDNCGHSGSHYGFGHRRRGRHRGLFFFIEMRAKHYNRINEILKLLRDIHLENLKKGFDDIFRQYRFSVKLPDFLYLYKSACLHLKRENTVAGEALDSLPQLLMTHNEKIDYAEDYLIEKVNNTFTSHQLTYDRTGGLFNNVLKILSSVWQAYDGGLVKSFDKERLINYFERSCPRDDTRDILYLFMANAMTALPLWQGSEEEKGKVIESIKTVLVDSKILGDLNDLQKSKAALEASLAQIRKVATGISEAIEADDYMTTAKCCPTILGLIWNYFIGG